MKWILRQVFNPTKYLSIRHGSGWFTSKYTVDWLVPGFLTASTIAFFYVLSIDVDFLGAEGLLTRFLDLLELMAAFFIAALAAVATFDRHGLDEKIKGDPVLMKRYRASVGEEVEEVLTTRQFICYLFGYLSMTSILLFVLINFTRVAAPKILTLVNSHSPIAKTIMEITAQAFLFFFLWQLIITMLIGIYFLTDRLQVLDDSDV